MEIIPRVGLDILKLGLTADEVINSLGVPTKDSRDEFEDRFMCYHGKGIAVRFEDGNDNRVGWIIVSNPSVTLYGIQPIGMDIDTVINHLEQHLNEKIDIDDFDDSTSRTFEDSWVEVQETLGFVQQINIGVPYDDKDNPLWPE